MSRTKEMAKKTRSDLLDAALTVFSQKGFHATTLNEIAGIAGVTKGSVFHHFDTKTDLYIAVIEIVFINIENSIQESAQEGGTFPDIIRRVLISYFTLIENDSRFRETVALHLSNTIIPADHKILADTEVYNYVGKQVERIRYSFQTAIINGEVRNDLVAKAASSAFFAFLNGVSILWLAGSKELSLKENMHEIVDMFLQSILKK